MIRRIISFLLAGALLAAACGSDSDTESTEDSDTTEDSETTDDPNAESGEHDRDIDLCSEENDKVDCIEFDEEFFWNFVNRFDPRAEDQCLYRPDLFFVDIAAAGALEEPIKAERLSLQDLTDVNIIPPDSDIEGFESIFNDQIAVFRIEPHSNPDDPGQDEVPTDSLSYARALQAQGIDASPVLTFSLAGHWTFAPDDNPEALDPPIELGAETGNDPERTIAVIDTGLAELASNEGWSDSADWFTEAAIELPDNESDLEPAGLPDELAGHGSFIASLIRLEDPDARVVLVRLSDAATTFRGPGDGELNVGTPGQPSGDAHDFAGELWLSDELQLLYSVARLTDTLRNANTEVLSDTDLVALNISGGTYPCRTQSPQYVDSNANGVPDRYAKTVFDTDEDGWAEFDLDGDGDPDAFDNDGDGFADDFEYYPGKITEAGTTEFNLDKDGNRAYDTNGDGFADEFYLNGGEQRDFGPDVYDPEIDYSPPVWSDFDVERIALGVRLAIDLWNSESGDVPVVAAAGNDSDEHFPYLPARFNDVIGVASTDACGSAVSDFSNGGAGLSGVSTQREDTKAPGEKLIGLHPLIGPSTWSGSSFAAALKSANVSAQTITASANKSTGVRSAAGQTC